VFGSAANRSIHGGEATTPTTCREAWEMIAMVTAVAGVNGRMGKKDDKDREKDSRKTKVEKGSKGGSFLDDNPNLRNTLAQIEKEFGEGSIMPLGADAQVVIEGISSGSLSVDLALGG